MVEAVAGGVDASGDAARRDALKPARPGVPLTRYVSGVNNITVCKHTARPQFDVNRTTLLRCQWRVNDSQNYYRRLLHSTLIVCQRSKQLTELETKNASRLLTSQTTCRVLCYILCCLVINILIACKKHKYRLSYVNKRVTDSDPWTRMLAKRRYFWNNSVVLKTSGHL